MCSDVPYLMCQTFRSWYRYTWSGEPYIWQLTCFSPSREAGQDPQAPGSRVSAAIWEGEELAQDGQNTETEHVTERRRCAVCAARSAMCSTPSPPSGSAPSGSSTLSSRLSGGSSLCLDLYQRFWLQVRDLINRDLNPSSSTDSLLLPSWCC